MEPLVKVISPEKPSIWKVRGHSKTLKRNKIYLVVCFEPQTAISWIQTEIEDFRVSAVQMVGAIDLVSELEGNHQYYAVSFQQPSYNGGWISTERAGVSAQTLIQAGATLLKTKPIATLLSLNHCGKIDAVLDVRTPDYVIPSTSS